MIKLGTDSAECSLMSYESGALFAFLVTLFSIIAKAAENSGFRNSNLNKLGRFYNFWLDSHTRFKKNTYFSVVIPIAFRLTLATVFSWLTVLLSSLSYVWQKKSRANMHPKLKEFLLLISTREYTKDALLELDSKISQELGMQTSSSSSEEMPEEVTVPLYHVDNNTCFSVNTSALTFKNSYSTNDGYSAVSEGEYKIDPQSFAVTWRTLYSASGIYGSYQIFIRDGVVLEQGIRNALGDSLVLSKDDVEDRIRGYKAECEWHPNTNLPIRIFILSRHPNIVKPADFRRLVRLEIERLKVGCSKVLAFHRSHSVETTETEHGWSGRFRDGTSEEVRESIRQSFIEHEASGELGTTFTEIESYFFLQTALHKFLGETFEREETKAA
jgi:hypothetical protein